VFRRCEMCLRQCHRLTSGQELGLEQVGVVEELDARVQDLSGRDGFEGGTQ